MTHENLELRAWIAVNLMGVRAKHHQSKCGTYWLTDLVIPGGVNHVDNVGKLTVRDLIKAVPPYESTWEGMGLVVEAMRARGWEVLIILREGRDWTAIFNHGGLHRGFSHQHAPMAVALAARAVMEEPKESSGDL